jgi:hypothetical protein
MATNRHVRVQSRETFDRLSAVAPRVSGAGGVLVGEGLVFKPNGTFGVRAIAMTRCGVKKDGSGKKSEKHSKILSHSHRQRNRKQFPNSHKLNIEVIDDCLFCIIEKEEEASLSLKSLPYTALGSGYNAATCR